MLTRHKSSTVRLTALNTVMALFDEVCIVVCWIRNSYAFMCVGREATRFLVIGENPLVVVYGCEMEEIKPVC